MNILIVEDDPMVDFIHRNYLKKDQFKEVYSARTLAEAESLLSKKHVDLILLDIHLRDGNGMDLLRNIRKSQKPIEVILITAANESQTVMGGLHLGVVDYLIKPFEKKRFQKSLDLFFKRKTTLNAVIVQQQLVDQLINSKLENMSTEDDLDKGLSVETLNLIKAEIKSIQEPFTIQDLVDTSGLSHVSIRKYVVHLEEQNEIHSKVIYTKIGRPYKIYYRY